MERINNGLRFIICVVPSYLIGLCLTYFFRHIDGRTQFFITALLITGCMYLIYRMRQSYFQDNNTDRIPFLLHGSMYVLLWIASIGGFFWSYMTYKTDVFFDNGRNTPMVISENSYGTLTIPANSSKEFVLPIAVNHIIVDGKPKTLKITEKGSWIFNFNKMNTYIEATVQYKILNDINQEQANLPGLESEPKPKLINDEFFNTKAELLFTAPDTLKVEESKDRKLLSKVVLYRVNVDKKTGNIAILN